ncbi:PilZ domain-containing protein [Pseudomonas sp. C27(2019)]|uniref:PilZ domain-containing protein n=1 Tax=Pseudomonas sp. C27(2019) TaxID=2604941 RepID=UPI0012444BD8|nr:PilZ domain-containing protein [Pseudomonas sp. C27(2019)]QEY60218.1 PilZ domain-containing protein [Pseudomonas sp. C27(2019)]
MTTDIRQSIRTCINCQIKIWHPLLGEIFATTEDLSDEGVLINHPDIIKLKIGDIVSGQVQGLPIEAPILQMEVVRTTTTGVGLRFCQDT